MTVNDKHFVPIRIPVHHLGSKVVESTEFSQNYEYQKLLKSVYF